MSELDFKPYKAIVPGEIYRGLNGSAEIPIVMLSRFKYPSLAEGVEYVQSVMRIFKQTEPIVASEDLELNPSKAMEFFVSRLPEEVRGRILSGEKTAIGKLEQHFGNLGMTAPDKNNYLTVSYGLVPAEDIKKNSGKSVLHNRIFYEKEMKKVRRGKDAYNFVFTIGDGLRLPDKGKVDLFFENPARGEKVIMVEQGDFYDFRPIQKMTNLIYENMPNGSIESVRDVTQLRLQTLATAGMQHFLEHLSVESMASNLAAGLVGMIMGSGGIPQPGQPNDKPEGPKSDGFWLYGDNFAA